MASIKKLDTRTRAQVLHTLMEGVSIRGTARLTGVSKTTILKLIEDAGHAAAWYQDRVFQNLQCTKIQADEIWGFVGSKAANTSEEKKATGEAGDVWLWIATCADTKLVPSWFLGPRDAESAYQFMYDLSERLVNRVQLTSDGLRVYIDAVWKNFGENIDFGQLVKLYGPGPEGQRRYSPAECIGITKNSVFGNPDAKHISTSFSERNNLNVRMHSRRMTRLTNGFSKKLENHACAMALHFLYYNFVRVHQTLKVSPAMAAGITKRLWEMSDVVDMLEGWEASEARKVA